MRLAHGSLLRACAWRHGASRVSVSDRRQRGDREFVGAELALTHGRERFRGVCEPGTVRRVLEDASAGLPRASGINRLFVGNVCLRRCAFVWRNH